MNPVIAELIAAGRAAGSLTVRTDPPFRWASGARMPVYNDNRRLMATPRGRAAVSAALSAVISDRKLPFDGFAGTASAGIAPATLLAEAFNAPLYYVRSAAKEHGRGRRIEGMPDEGLSGARLILVEDLVSTGGSSAAAAEALLQAGATVVACVAIFSYGFPAAQDRFRSLPGAPPVYAAATVTDLIADGVDGGRLSEADTVLLRDWQRDPFGWYGRIAGSGETGGSPGRVSPMAGGAGDPPDPAGRVGAPESAGNYRVGGSGATDRRDAAGSPRSAAVVARAVRARHARSLAVAGHLLCVGLDPRPELIPPGHSISDFLRSVVEEIARTGTAPGAFKPNIAYFHQLDRPLAGQFSGSRALAEVMDAIRQAFPEVPVILDAKRGDISGTSVAYAREAFASWEVDALTVAPYMGDDSVSPFLEAAAGGGPAGARWVYLLNRTSNPGAARFQNQPVGDPPRPLYRSIAVAIAEWQGRYGTAGAVIGATAPEEFRRLLEIHAERPVPILLPGIGAQGAQAGDILRQLRESGYPGELVRLNASRQVTFPWSRDGRVPRDWHTAVRDSYRRLAEEAQWR